MSGFSNLLGHDLLLGSLHIHRLSVEIQLSPHLLLGEADVRDPCEEHINTVEDLIQLGPFLLRILSHGVEDELRLHGWFGWRRVGRSRTTDLSGMEISGRRRRNG